MIRKIKFNAYEIPHVFGNEEKEIELDLGSINGTFWGENISMVSAIVGKNGTGKTSILRSIKDSYIDAINDLGEKVSNSTFLKIFYSSNLSYENEQFEDETVINLSQYSRLKKELRGDEVGVTEMLEIHNSEFCLDLIQLKKNEELNSLLQDLRLPKFEKYEISLLKLKEDDWNISRNLRPYFDELGLKKDQERSVREQQKIDELGLTNIEEIKGSKEYDETSYKIRLELEVINAVVLKVKRILERTGNRYLEEGFIDEPISNLENVNSYKQGFYWIIEKAYFKLTRDSQPIFLPFREIEEFTDALLSIVDEQQNFSNWTKFSVNSDVAYNFIIKYQSFIRAFKSNFAYDDYPILRLNTDMLLSNGERSMYELFSQMYKCKIAISNGEFNFENEFETFLILLDEADLSFHPTWKKCYISLLIKILPVIFKGKKIQIIFTTHDPLALSDVPKQNVIFLDKNDEGQTIITEQSIETFGANVNELLADSFFISDGLMGNFAKQKIQDLVSFLTFDADLPAGLDNKKPIEPWDENSALQLIEIVGEPVIQERLQSLFDIKFNISEKEALESKINELQQKLDELNEKNSDR